MGTTKKLIDAITFALSIIILTVPSEAAERSATGEDDVSVIVNKLLPTPKPSHGKAERDEKCIRGFSPKMQGWPDASSWVMPAAPAHLLCDIAWIREQMDDSFEMIVMTIKMQHRHHGALPRGSAKETPEAFLAILGEALQEAKAPSSVYTISSDDIRNELTTLNVNCSWIPGRYRFEGELKELEGYFSVRIGGLLKEVDFSRLPKDSIILANQFFAKFQAQFAGKEGKGAKADVHAQGPEYYLDKAAQRYHSGALRELALLKRDKAPDDACRLIHLAAVQGHPDALFDLAVAYNSDPYAFNLATERNPHLAGLFYRAAAQAKHSEAECVIASAYLNGEFGFPSAPEEGIRKLQELASKGNKRAEEALRAQEAFKEAPELLGEFD